MTTTLSVTALLDMPGLPTYRQIDRWCRTGILGEDKKALGSGRRRAWTEHEISKLRALHTLEQDLGTLGITIPELEP